MGVVHTLQYVVGGNYSGQVAVVMVFSVIRNKGPLKKWIWTSLIMGIVLANAAWADNTTGMGLSGMVGQPAINTVLAASPAPDFGKELYAGLTAMHTAGAALASKLVPVGEQLLGVFFAIMLVWYIFEGMAEQQLDSMFRKIIQHTMLAMIGMELLASWGSPTGLGVAHFLEYGLDELSTAFTQAGDPSDKVIDVYDQAIQGMFSMVTNDLSNFSLYNVAKSAVGGGLGWMLLMAILTLIVALICVALLMLSMTYALIYINIGAFIVYIGLAVGPVFVATLVFPPAQGYFQNWVNFVISGGIYKLVAVVVGDIMAQVLIEVGKHGSNVAMMANGAGVFSGAFDLLKFLLYSLLLVFWSLFAYFLTKHISNFVHSLAGGINLHMGSLSSLRPSMAGSLPGYSKIMKARQEHLEAKQDAVKAQEKMQAAEAKAAEKAQMAEAKAAAKAQMTAEKNSARARVAEARAAAKAQTAAAKPASRARKQPPQV
jgi:hypothetical protein